MNRLPSIELLEATHSFPGIYHFKAIGTNENNFMGRVVVAVRRELPGYMEPAFSFRKTAAGRHVAVSIEPEVAHAEQVLDIYENLCEIDGLVMLL